MKHFLPDLPYEMNALSPVLSAETLEHHWGKHHRAYIDKLNQLIVGSAFEESSLEEMILKANGSIFNQAAQIWNHTFYWNSLTTALQKHKTDLTTNSSDPKSLLAAIQKKFNGLESFFEKLHLAGMSLFGSGWLWLVYDPKQAALEIITTGNAENPMKTGQVPLFTIDLWEHSYYIDYRQDRSKYLKTIFPLINWEFAQKNWILTHP